MRILCGILSAFAAICAGLPGCGSGTSGVPTIPPPPQPAAHVAPASRPAEMPDYLERRAEAAFVARRLQPERRDDYISSFKSGYCDAVTSPAASMWEADRDGKPDVAFADGVAAGKGDSPLPVDNYIALFTAKGYTRQTVTGEYTVEFEKSALRISGQSRSWWLARTPYLARPPENGQLTVTGLVSPEGLYGHLGGYSHEILALEIRSP